MEKQARRTTTMRLTVALREALGNQARAETRSVTSLCEEAGWMLLEARKARTPLQERIPELTGEVI